MVQVYFTAPTNLEVSSDDEGVALFLPASWLLSLHDTNTKAANIRIAIGNLFTLLVLIFIKVFVG